MVLVPIGFISDHMEVIFDLDTEAAETAAELGLTFVRAATAGVHPAFVDRTGRSAGRAGSGGPRGEAGQTGGRRRRSRGGTRANPTAVPTCANRGGRP